MKKYLSLLIVLYFHLSGLNAQIQYQWHKRVAGANSTNENIDCVVFDKAGNVYVSGQHGEAITTDISIGYSSQFVGAKNGFIAKLDPLGNPIWVKNFTTSNSSNATLSINSLAVDDVTGRIYFCGRGLAGYADLDPGAGVVTIGAGQGFIGCLDKNGIYQWGGGFTNVPYVPTVRLRPNGDPVFGATFYNNSGANIDVDVSAAVASMPVSNSGVRYGGFILMYAASGAYQGYSQAAVSLPPFNNNIYMHGAPSNYSEDALTQDLEIDASGNIFLAVNSPWYNGMVVMGKDLFLVKFNSAGVYQSNVVLLNTIHVQYHLTSMDLDASGNVYIGGYFGASFDFDPSAATNTLSACWANTNAGFIAKYDNNLAYLGATKIQSNLACGSMTATQQSYVFDLAVGGSSVYAVGLFTDVTDFDASASNATATSAGGNDSYLAKFNTSLVYQNHATWGSPLTSPNTETTNMIDANASQEVVVGGLVDNNIPDINPQAGTVPITLLGGQDGLVAKYYECAVAAAITTPPANITVCQGASATLSIATTGTALTFQWRKGGVNIPGATSNQYTIPTTVAGDAGNYDVVIGNLCNATTLTSSVATLTISTGPSGGITGSNSICTGSSTTLTAPAGSSYIWSNAATTAAITVNPTINTTYTVTATNASGCTATVSSTVTVNALPTAAVTGTNTICNGASTTLTASGGGTYSWSNAATTAATTVSPTTTTTYTVTVTNAAGCTATANRTVTVNALPTAAVTGTNTICNGASTTLTASGGGTYSWSTTAITAAITVSPTTTTTYTVTVTGGNGCTATATRTVTVNALPTASIAGTNNICTGSSTTLTASGGSSYTWSNASTTAAITVTPTSNTTYIVTVTNGNGCTATTSSAVTVNALPTASVTGTNTICNGASTTLTASGGGSYTWSNTATTTAITVNPSTTTTYTVTVTNAAGCTATANRTVTVNALPTASISGTNTICNGNSTTLTASGGGTYTWSNTATTTAITVTPTNNTTYTVTVTGSNGCTTTTSSTVSVNALPTASVTGTNTICNGSSTTLTASGGSTYTWSNTASTAAITVNPSTTTTYTVTVTNAAGCTATANRTVTVNALPTASITGTNTICNGASSTLTANGGGSYIWSSGATTAAITISPTTNTTYDLTVTAGNGCTATTSSTVIVNALPTASITGTNTICDGASTTLTANGGNSYAWSNAATTAVITVTPATTTTYTVTVTDANNCSATATNNVIVNPNPTVNISGNTDICLGTTTTLTATGGTSYSWTTAETTPDIIVSPTVNTVYVVTATNSFSCTNSASVTVTVLAPTIITNSTQQLILCENSPLSLSATATGSGTLAYTWDLNSQTLSSTTNTYNDASLSTNEGGIYTVIVSGTCGADTAIIANLIVNPMTTSTDTALICQGDTYNFNGQFIGTTGIYMDTLVGSNSCDSIVTLHLVVNSLPTPIITMNGSILSTGTFDTYQWFLNGTAIAGANAQTYTPVVNGSYSVSVTNASGCSGQSTTFNITTLEVNDIHSLGLIIYPNPTNSRVYLKGEIVLNIEIYAIDGSLIQHLADVSEFDMTPFASGVYMVRLTTAKGTGTTRIVKID